MDASTLIVKCWNGTTLARNNATRRVNGGAGSRQDWNGRQRASNVQRKDEDPADYEAVVRAGMASNDPAGPKRGGTSRTKTQRVGKIDWKAVCDTMRVTWTGNPGRSQPGAVGRSKLLA